MHGQKGWNKEQTRRSRVGRRDTRVSAWMCQSLTPFLLSSFPCVSLFLQLVVRQAALRCLSDLFSAHCAQYWRQGQRAPGFSDIYRGIPKRLVLTSRLDRHMAVTVDVLLDEHILGAATSVEERTRCLIGVYSALLNKPTSGEGEEGMKEALRKYGPLARSRPELERQDACLAFEKHILLPKAHLHQIVNKLIDLVTQARSRSAAVGGAEHGDFERTKHQQLSLLARALSFADQGATLEDLMHSLHLLFFEAKDKNVLKCLRTLANPLTEYEQIRTAMGALITAVKQMGVAAQVKNKKVRGGRNKEQRREGNAARVLPVCFSCSHLFLVFLLSSSSATMVLGACFSCCFSGCHGLPHKF